MPELPDVEVLRQYADTHALHRRIDDVMLREQLVEDTSPQTIRDHLRGSELTEARRHGKHLFLRSSDDGWLRLHFGMTGTLAFYSDGEAPTHTELRLDFDDGSHLAYVNQRKFGAISWIDDVAAFVQENELGPDPLDGDVGWSTFLERVGSRGGTIKGTLMNQEVLAGLGNVYVDEILFQSGIDPRSDTQALDEDHLEALHRTMHEVINEAISDEADVEEMPPGWLVSNREPGSACPRCDGTIQRTEVSGRSTYFCPDHQQRIG